MFTFRSFTIIFFICLLGLNLAAIFGCGAKACFFCVNLPWLYAGLVATYLGISVTMAFVPASGYHYPVISCGSTEEKMIAITFDDGPDHLKTPILLDILKKYNTPVSFFLIGKKIGGNESLLKRIDDEGHIVGIHSWSHSTWFDFFTPAVIKRELIMTTEAVIRALGKTPLLFRPPYGVINPMLARALRSLPHTVIVWSIRSLDTIPDDPGRILDKMMEKIHPGAVILLHDHSAFTAGNLERLIVKIREAGYRIVPLDELLRIKAYAD
jgi:peptidoglycan-N-acetylglucosamine deacetylase